MKSNDDAAMMEFKHHYIDGAWVEPHAPRLSEITNPATEEVIGRVALGDARDVDHAVAAARRAFATQRRASRAERRELLQAVIHAYDRRMDEIADALSREMGAPYAHLARPRQVPAGLRHLNAALQLLETFEFERALGTATVVREPIGVCALITPWNWPINQITCKVAPALATGCTMVLKPSELAPLSAGIFAQILHEAGVPRGVFNQVNGDGPTVGAALAAHPDVDYVSFTGSGRAGRAILVAAADTIKKVSLELGGKSAYIVTPDADLARAVEDCVRTLLVNSGQNCNAPSRLLVPAARMAEAESLAMAAARAIAPGMPDDARTQMGPLANRMQYERVRQMIDAARAEGARVLSGGDRPAGLERGYFVSPTILSDVDNRMHIAQHEIFGPVLCMIPYRDIDDAIAIANDTPLGLSGYVFGSDVEEARAIALQLRTGNVHLNGARMDTAAPFGGYKQSGLGREMGVFGFEEYLEVKSIFAQPA